MLELVFLFVGCVKVWAGALQRLLPDNGADSNPVWIPSLGKSSCLVWQGGRSMPNGVFPLQSLRTWPVVAAYLRSSSLSFSSIVFISWASSAPPCILQSWKALQAGYAHHDIASGNVCSFPGTYLTIRLNFENVSCHRPLRPDGPDGVSTCSVAQCSRAL